MITQYFRDFEIDKPAAVRKFQKLKFLFIFFFLIKKCISTASDSNFWRQCKKGFLSLRHCTYLYTDRPLGLIKTKNKNDTNSHMQNMSSAKDIQFSGLCLIALPM